MAEGGVLRFVVEMADKISAPAKNAEKELRRLEDQLKREGTALERLESKMVRMNQQDKVSLEQHRSLTDRITDKRAKLVQLHGSVGEVTQAESAMQGAVAELGTKLLAFGTVAAVAAGAAEGLHVALELVGEGLHMAIEASELKNDTLDMLEAMTGSAEAAEETYHYINAIQGEVAISQRRGSDLASQLSAAGITESRSLQDAIRTIGEVESVLGEGAGGKVQNILERSAQSGKFQISAKMLAGTGIQVQKLYEEIGARTHKGVKQVEAEMKAGKISAEVGIAALTNVLDTKFAGVAQKQVLDFGNQMTRFHDNISRLFEDVNVEPLMKGLASLLSIFDQSTTSGKIMHDVITGFFNKVSDLLSRTIPYVKTFFKGMLLLGLQAYIGLKPLLRDLGLIGTPKQRANLQGLVMIFRVLAAETLILARGFSGLMMLTLRFQKLLGFVGSLPLRFLAAARKIGHAVVEGFKEGILGGIGGAVGVVRQFGQETLNELKSIWKIASPSKVADHEVAGMIGLGFVRGLDRMTGPANDAVGRMASPAPARAAAATASGGRGGNVTLRIEAGAIVVNGVANAEQLQVTLPAILADVFEQAVNSRAAAAA